MLSSIFIALLQAVAGDPAAPATTEQPALEAPAAAATETAPRTERRRVCRTYEAATGGRLSQRRCRYVDVPVNDGAGEGSADAGDTGDAEAGPGDARGDTSSAGASATSPPPSPQ